GYTDRSNGGGAAMVCIHWPDSGSYHRLLGRRAHRKRGVTMPPTYPSSRATIYAVLLFTVGTTCALVAVWAHNIDTPLVIFLAATVSAATTTFTGSRIDREIVEAGRKQSVSK